MEQQNQNKRPLKIVVVGSKGHPREVQCYNWAEISKVPNIADQDAVIIDMTTLDEETLKKIASNLPRNFVVDYFFKLFRSEGKVFIITVPTIEVEISTTRIFNNYWWNPFEVKFKIEKGDTIKNVLDSFQRYFSNVKYWNFTIEPAQSLTKIINLGVVGSPQIMDVLAKNRYDAALGIKIAIPDCGKYCFLPPPTEISSKAAIDIILEDFFGIKISETAEPDWVKEIKLPNEEEIQKEIQERLDKMESENREIEKLEKRKRGVVKFRKLLYTEDEELEQIVWATFRELGANVIEPKEKNKEDGWIVTKFGKGILEIKKAAKSASRKHTRQLDNWVGNCIANNEKCKGILVINHYGDKPLKERKEPFPSDVREHAKEARSGNPFCLLTTVELFNAYCAFKKKRISSDEIFKKIFEADGEECKLI